MYRKQENSTLNERLKVIPAAKLLTKSSDSINRSKVVQSPKVTPKVRPGFAKSLSSHFGTPEPTTSTRNDGAQAYMTRSLSIASIFRVPQRERETPRRGEEKRGKWGKAEESRDRRTGEAKASSSKRSSNTNTDGKGDSNAGRLTTIFNRIGSIRLRNRSINFESISIDISDKSNSKDDPGNRGDYKDEQNRGTVLDTLELKCQDVRFTKLDSQKSSKIHETNFSYDEEFNDPFNSDDETEAKSWQSDPVKSAPQRTLTLWRSFSRRKRQRKNKELISESLDLDDRLIRSCVVGSGCADIRMELQLESDIRYLKLDSDFASRRQEDYVAALNRLYKFNVAHGYLAEAAFALCAHAQLCASGAENRLESSEERALLRRKNDLLSCAVELFDRAKMWEDAIAAADVLAKTYKSKFMYVELSEVLQKQATFYRNILQRSSCETRYFAVEFHGQVLPGFLRGRTFVVRTTVGNSIERNIQESFHLNGFSGKNVDSTDIRSLSRHFKVMTLKPMPDLDFFGPISSSSNNSSRMIPVVVEHYHRHNNVNRFEIVSSDNEQGAILVTESKLPGVSRWSLAEKVIK